MNTEQQIEQLRASLFQEQAARHAAEAMLERNNDTLTAAHQEIAELNRKLEASTNQASSNNQYLDQLLITSNRLSLLVQNLQYGLVLSDEKSHIFLANRRICDIFNVIQHPEDLVGLSCVEAAGRLKLFFKNPDEFEARIFQLLEEKQQVTGEQLEMKNGKIVQRDYIPIWNKGRYDGHLWVFNDITEKVVTATKLAEQRQFYEEVLNQLPGDVAVMKPDRTFLFLNPSAIADKYLREWMIGKKDEDYCRVRQRPLELAEKRKEIIEEVLRTKMQVSWEEAFQKPDSTLEYHKRNITPILDLNSEVKMLIGYGTNITEQKNIEQKIQRSEKRYHDLFTYSQALICTHDAVGTILTVNPALYELMGFTAAEMTGKKIYEFLPEEDRMKFISRYLPDILRKGKDEGLFRVVCKDGKKLFLLYQNYKMEEPATEAYVIGFAQNITTRIEQEQELRNAKLLTEQAARAKEIFLANMSHEIRTPMNGILGMANLLAKTKLSLQQQKYLDLIKESANNLLKIVNDVLDLEKIVMGKLQFEEVTFSLSKRIASCIQSFTFKAEEKNVSLAYNNRLKRDVIVASDPHRLSQVLNNLIGNALKFTDSGSVTIETTIRAEQGDMILINFSIEDTGIGIPADKLLSIFEPFTQAHSSVSRKYGGTGLGLSICRELIQLLGGELKVESCENAGSVFSFTLPFKISYEKPEQLMAVPESNFRNLGKRKILLAEDVELNQYLARHIMESWGLEVTVVDNGMDAVEFVKGQHFDLVLMDIQMPGMNGMDATRNIRALQDAQKAAIPIIALTANALRGDSERYLAIGMNGYVSKPFDETKLYHMISHNLNITQLPTNAPTMQNELSVTSDLSNQLYSLDGLHSVSGGDQAFVKRMIYMFIDTVPGYLHEMQQFSLQKNWEATGKAAHRLKPTLDTLGVAGVKNDIRTIEINGEQKQLSDEVFNELVNKVVANVEDCISQLKQDFPRN